MTEFQINNVVEVSPSDLSFGEWARIYWALSWRGLVIMLLGALSGGIIGFIIGLIGGIILGSRVKDFMWPLQGLAMLVTLPVGIGFWVMWFRWVLKTKMGSLRLAIVRVPSLSPLVSSQGAAAPEQQ